VSTSPGQLHTKLIALKGKRVTVRLKSRAGTRAVRSVLRVPASTVTPVTPPPVTPPPGTTPTGPQSPFTPPASTLEGDAAWNHISPYFVGSRFTDCLAGWPACLVEERYNHCPDGTLQYYRLTSTSGSDINSVGSYQVTGAVANTDGSWRVEYIASFYGQQSFYSWNVAANGTVTGAYWAPGNAPPNPPSYGLGQLQWVGSVPCTTSPY
jgi:hypothetical protein